jgi:hypothetical protein
VIFVLEEDSTTAIYVAAEYMSITIYYVGFNCKHLILYEEVTTGSIYNVAIVYAYYEFI